MCWYFGLDLRHCEAYIVLNVNHFIVSWHVIFTIQQAICPINTRPYFFSHLCRCWFKSKCSCHSGLMISCITLVQSRAEGFGSSYVESGDTILYLSPLFNFPLKFKYTVASFPGYSGQKDNGNFVHLLYLTGVHLEQGHKKMKKWASYPCLCHLPNFPFCFPLFIQRLRNHQKAITLGVKYLVW